MARPVGLHAGPVLIQEILVSQAVVDAAVDAGAAFSEIGPIELKGISEAIRLHIARRG